MALSGTITPVTNTGTPVQPVAVLKGDIGGAQGMAPPTTQDRGQPPPAALPPAATPPPVAAAPPPVGEKPPEGQAATPPPAGEKPPEGQAPPQEPESWRLAALTQKEKAAREARAEARAAEERATSILRQVEEKEARVKDFQTQFDQRRGMYARNPLLLLQDHGIDYNQLSEFVAKGGWTPEQQAALEKQQIAQGVQITQAEVQKLRQEMVDREAKQKEDMEARATEARAAEVKAAENRFRRSITDTLKAEAAEFELCNEDLDNSTGVIYGAIEKHYNDTGKILSVKEAATALENQIFDRLSGVVSKAKKFEALRAPPPQQAMKPRAQARTMTNGPNGTTAPTAGPPTSESPAERRQRVLDEVGAILKRRNGE